MFVCMYVMYVTNLYPSAPNLYNTKSSFLYVSITLQSRKTREYDFKQLAL